jgi:ParB family protein of integrating conjugative element (PFGI_1 class)
MNAIAKDQAVTKKLLGHPQNDKEKTHHKLLTIDQIIPYDRNPRRAINPRYDEIKAAIRAAGKLNNLLSVTRRPDSTLYMVESGGNTRLQILHELWQETHNENFYKTDCLIVPWQSESHVLSAHLIENELRGDMTLIDKAMAIKELKAQLENEGGQALSTREFSRQLGSKGYLASSRQLTRFHYAADFLEPLIPMALNAGLGNDKVDRLRKIQAGYSKCLTEFGATQNFEPMFAQALTEHDDEDLEIDALQRTLDNYIVNCTGHPLNRVRLHVDTLLLDNHGEQESSLEPFDSPYQPAPCP